VRTLAAHATRIAAILLAFPALAGRPKGSGLTTELGLGAAFFDNHVIVGTALNVEWQWF
jgi:hypothetical protein